MNKASSSFFVFLLTSMTLSTHVYAQRIPGPRIPNQPPVVVQPQPIPLPQQMNEVLSERIQQTLQMQQRLRLGDLLRLQAQDQQEIEVLSLTISAQSIRGRGQLDVLSKGQIAQSLQIKKQLSEVRIALAAQTRLESLELMASDEIFLESVTAEIRRLRPRPMPQPIPQQQQVQAQSMVTLQINQQIRGMGEIPLKALVQQQLGLSLEGAEIERIVIEGQPLMSGRAASVSIELNNRIVGQAKYLMAGAHMIPMVIRSTEEILTLKLLVQGDALINTVRIRVGNVRPILQPQMRIIVSQEISASRGLELASLLANENRLVRSIQLEARSLMPNARIAQEVALLSIRGELLATVSVNAPMRPVLKLMRPISVRELKLQSLSPVMVDALTLEF